MASVASFEMVESQSNDAQREAKQVIPRSVATAVVIVVALAAAVAVAKRAWVAQDAFITFRYIENFKHGHGLVFNVGERVQGFTHPLWTLLLCLGPLEYLPQYAIALGLLFTLLAQLAVGALGVGRPILTPPAAVERGAALRGLIIPIAFGFAFFTSRSAREWSTSGLENGLTHACVAFAIFLSLDSIRLRRFQALFCLTVGLLAFNRMDQAPLIAGLVLFAAREARDRGDLKRFVRHALIGVTPLLAWLLFAALYYGYPLPNTAYAKLGGFTRLDAVQNGALYLFDFAKYEPWHAGILVLAMLSAVLRPSWADRRVVAVLRAAAAGIAFQLIYILYVGGDYMRGRFLTSALLVACIVTAVWMALWAAPRPRPAVAVMLAAFLLLPVVRFVAPREPAFDGQTGVSRISTLYRPTLEALHERQLDTYSQLRAARSFSHVVAFSSRFGNVAVLWPNLGDETYAYGGSLPVIDPLGLTDPFIARCKASRKSRPGHVQRAIPRAYLLARGVVNIHRDWDARVAQLDPVLARNLHRAMSEVRWDDHCAEQSFHELEVLTRAPLLTWERFKLIAKYTFTNPAAYDVESDAPSIPASEAPAGMFRIDPSLTGAVRLIGVEPGQVDYSGPRSSGNFWLGPREDGEVEVLLESRSAVFTVLKFLVEPGVSFPDTGQCPLILLLDDRPVGRTTVAQTARVAFPFRLDAGRHKLTIRLDGSPGSSRPWLDPRPLMLYASGLSLSSDPAGSPAP